MRLSLLLSLALTACSGGDALVVVTVSSTGDLTVAKLHANATAAGHAKAFDVALPGGKALVFPPDHFFAVQVPAGYAGAFSITVDALDSGGATLASGSNAGTTHAGSRTNLSIELEGGVNPDMGGEDGPSASCQSGMACQTGAGAGLCDGVNCLPCTDTTDDASCAAVYGAGYLCIGGQCVGDGCRSPSDCGGKPCVDNQCSAGCAGDSDCLNGKICNTTTGVCVSNACAGQGTTCSANPADVCCSSVCVAGKCCGTDPCAVPPSGTNNGTCASGACVLNSCTAPADSKRYVDPGAPAGGSGSMACPFIDLATALNSLPSGGTVIVKSGATLSVSNSINVPAGVDIIGSDGSFAPCTSGTCPTAASWPTLQATTNIHALNYLAPGSNTLQFFNFTGSAGSTVCGLYANTATLTVSHVRVTAFDDGICAGASSVVHIQPDVQSTNNNSAGLTISSLGVVDIQASNTAPAIAFNSNASYGIYCSGSGKLTINGPGPYTGAGSLFVTANNNKYGVRIYSSTGVSIAGLDVANNTAEGMYIYALSVVKVRNSRFHSNALSGVRIVANGANTAEGLQNIDFGSNSASDPGQNLFDLINANGVGFCVDAGPADAATNGSLLARGNTFGTKVCIGASAPALSRSKSCTGGYDIATDCAGAVSIGACSAGTCVMN